MTQPDANDLSEALRDPHRKLARLITSSSVLIVALYVLGFIYLKTYLSVFRFQIELASLSIPNLVLAHRFFVSQHFLVAAGFFHAFLVHRFTLQGLRKEWFSTCVLLAFPIALVPFGWVLSAWSERGTPPGFNIAAHGLWLPFAIGWFSGLFGYTVIQRVQRPLKRVRDFHNYLGAILLIALTVYSYRLYASTVAEDRLLRQDFQQLSQLVLGQSVIDPGPCGVVYVDSDNFYLLCRDERHVIRKSSLPHYRVSDPVANPAFQGTLRDKAAQRP